MTIIMALNEKNHLYSSFTHKNINYLRVMYTVGTPYCPQSTQCTQSIKEYIGTYVPITGVPTLHAVFLSWLGFYIMKIQPWWRWAYMVMDFD